MYYVVTRKTPHCGYCVSAKLLLEDANEDYEEIELNDVIELIKELGIKTVPAVFTSKPLSLESFLGGYDKLKDAIL